MLWCSLYRGENGLRKLNASQGPADKWCSEDLNPFLLGFQNPRTSRNTLPFCERKLCTELHSRHQSVNKHFLSYYNARIFFGIKWIHTAKCPEMKEAKRKGENEWWKSERVRERSKLDWCGYMEYRETLLQCPQELRSFSSEHVCWGFLFPFFVNNDILQFLDHGGSNLYF